MDWIKKKAVPASIVIGSVLAVLLASEAVLRLTPLSARLPYDGLPAHYYRADRAAGYDVAPNFATSTHRFADGSYDIWSNAQGCFDAAYAGETPYILLLGDSFAWGFTPYESKWGTVVERMLGERVLKCGIAGYGTRQELLKARSLLVSLPTPETVLVSYFKNDADDDAALPNNLVWNGRLIKNLSGDPSLGYDELERRLPQFAQWAQEYCMWNMPVHPTTQRIKCFLRRHSVLYVLGQETVKKMVPLSALRAAGLVNEAPPAIAAGESDMSEHYAALENFQSVAAQEGAGLLFVLIPAREDVFGAGDPYAAVKSFMDARGIRYLDPLEDFRAAAQATSSALYWRTDLHLNPLGNRLLGLLVAREMLLRTDQQYSDITAALKSEFSI